MADVSSVINTKSLSKKYPGSDVYAVKDLSIELQRGEVYGFLGPNGAGKSTTIRLLMNLIQPTHGSAQIFGQDIIKDSLGIRRRLGYLSGDFKAYEKMTTAQFIKYMNELQPPKRKSYSGELLRKFKLDAHKKIVELSKGNRQKVGVLQAFMHEPELFILDEPTDGLDPLMQETFYSLVRDAKKSGATLFISSHNLAEVRKICDRVGIIRDGKLVSESTIAELAHTAAQTFDITFKDKVPLSELRKLPKAKVKKVNEHMAEVHLHGDANAMIKLLSKYDVVQLSSQHLNLEDQFMQFYKTGRTR